MRVNSGIQSLHSYRKLSGEELRDCLAIKTEKIFASTSFLVISFIALCLASLFIGPLVIRSQRFSSKIQFHPELRFSMVKSREAKFNRLLAAGTISLRACRVIRSESSVKWHVDSK